jgi:hypothetical protein
VIFEGEVGGAAMRFTSAEDGTTRLSSLTDAMHQEELADQSPPGELNRSRKTPLRMIFTMLVLFAGHLDSCSRVGG